MPYHRIAPLPQLRPYVDGIWIQEQAAYLPEKDARPTVVLPTGLIDLVIHYGDPFVRVDGPKEKSLPSSHVAGQRTRPMAVRATGATGILIVSFFPWGARPFFDVPLVELREATVALEDLVGCASSSALKEGISNANSNEAKVRVAEEWLIRKLDHDPKDIDWVRSTVRLINESSGCIPVSDIADRMAISRRHLVRKFNDTIGLSPKQFASVVRFQKALYYIQQGVDWQDIIIWCNFYDQPHLIRTIRRFSQQTLAALGRLKGDTPLKRFFNNSADVQHLYNTIYL